MSFIMSYYVFCFAGGGDGGANFYMLLSILISEYFYLLGFFQAF